MLDFLEWKNMTYHWERQGKGMHNDVNGVCKVHSTTKK